MKVDDKLIAQLEDLSNMTLTIDEKSQLTKDLQKLINETSPLSALCTEGVPECSHPFEHVNAFREDHALPSFGRNKILQNAPKRNDEMIIAPKTVE